MSLFLNKIKVKGSSLKVSSTLPLAGEDMSGQSSYDEQAETGDKSMQVAVSLLIKYVDAVDLTLVKCGMDSEI